MFSSSIHSMISTAAGCFNSRSLESIVQMSMDDQQSTMPIYAVSQHSQCFLFTSERPSSIYTSLRVGSMGPFTNKMPSLEFSSSIEFPPFPFSSFTLNTSVRERCSENVVPNFSFQNSIFIPQACDFKGYHFNTKPSPNPNPMNRLNPQSESAKPKRLYRCEPCRAEFYTPQAYGGHMSHHSKVRKVREMEKRDANQGPTNSKKLKLGMNIPVKPNIIKEGDKMTEFEVKKEQDCNPFEVPKMKNDSIEADGSLIIPKEEIHDLEFNELDYMNLSSFLGI